MARNVFDLSKRDLEWVNPKEFDSTAVSILRSKWIECVQGTVEAGIRDAIKQPGSSLSGLSATDLSSTADSLIKTCGILDPIINYNKRKDAVPDGHETSLAEISKVWNAIFVPQSSSRSKRKRSSDSESSLASELDDVIELDQPEAAPEVEPQPGFQPDVNQHPNRQIHEETNMHSSSTQPNESPKSSENFDHFNRSPRYSKSGSAKPESRSTWRVSINFLNFESSLNDDLHQPQTAGSSKSHSKGPNGTTDETPACSKSSQNKGGQTRKEPKTTPAQDDFTFLESLSLPQDTKDEPLTELLKKIHEEGNKVYEDMAKEDAEYNFFNTSTSNLTLDKDCYNFLQMAGQTQKALDELSEWKKMENASRPFTDQSPVIGNSMPVLAPPIPPFAVKQSSCLSTYVTESHVPGRFQWTSESPYQRVACDVQTYLKKQTEAITTEAIPKELVSAHRDIVVLVDFYHPMGPSPNWSGKLKKACSIEILGRQTLSDLRSLLFCRTDALDDEIIGDDFPQPSLEVDKYNIVRKRNMEKPCVFFIGSKAYHSKRTDAACQDYAAMINNWNRFAGIDAPRFESDEMEKTRIMDLNFKTGFPYGFVHNEGCEHLVVFQRVCLPHPNSDPFVESYPFIKHINMLPINCEIDHENIAKFIVINFNGFPTETTFVCAHCLLSACYSNGKKISEFRVCPCYQAFDMTRVASEQLPSAEYECTYDE